MAGRDQEDQQDQQEDQALTEAQLEQVREIAREEAENAVRALEEERKTNPRERTNRRLREAYGEAA